MKEWLRERHYNILRILQIARYELNSATVHLRGKISPRQRSIVSRLRQARGLKLNVAGGRTRFDGWLNIDVLSTADIRMDLRRSLPLAEDSVALIFTEHFCDSLDYPHEIVRVLSEFHRVLAPGGRLRAVMLDGGALMRAYLDRDSRIFDRSDQTMMEAFNHLFRFHDFRPFCYDRETFERVLREAGFSNIIHCKYRESDCPEVVLEFAEPLSRELMSMCIEAVK